MMNNYTKGSLSLFTARVLSGLNVNAMGYLLPLWIAPTSCVTLRLVFGALVFWIISIFAKPESVELKDKIKLFLLGGLGIFGYMSLYAVSLSHTTPVSFAIFNAMQPLWVVVASAVIFHEGIDARKLMGIAVGFAGALLCILSEPNRDVADKPLLGNMLSIVASIIYAVYLVFSAKMVGHLSRMTILRYTFSSAAVVALLFSLFLGFSAPLFENGLKITPFLVLAFVLIFPTVLTYFLIPIGLKYLNSTVVAIYGYVTLIVASVVSFVTGVDKFEPVILLSLILIGVSIYFVGVNDEKKRVLNR
ncbi:MAG: DMT family transporter [Bacteroidaceae bacterium]|nr:DMT family transporter [Bacteroidaceae bacterium]